MNVSLIIALAIIVIIILYMLGNWFMNKRAVTELEQNEFHKGLRKAQVIDVREKVDYDYGHINGARNIQYQCLVKDIKVYVKINLFIFVMQTVSQGIVQHVSLKKMAIKIFIC